MLINRNNKRPDLIENRNSGICFSLCKRTKTCFQEIMPLSACKDFLNAVLWSERMNRPTARYCGYSHTPQGILKSKYIYLNTGVLSSNKHTAPVKYDLTSCLNFIHEIEKRLNLSLTKVYSTEEYSILQIDKYWSQYPYLISMYGLFFRSAKNYDGDFDKFIEKSKGYGDIGSRAISNYEFLITNKPPTQSPYNDISTIHTQGIKTINLHVL